MRPVARRLAALVLVLVAGCDSQSDADASRADVAAARAAFAESGPRDYTLAYELRCECIGGATVTVRDGAVVAASGPGAQSPLTADDLFALALRVFDDGRTGSVRLAAAAPRIPLEVDLDPDLAPMDGNVFLVVTRFEAD